MDSAANFAKKPKQERSRRSFDRAVDAAVALVVHRRSDTFTLAEVADGANVSIGSIYGRVSSKQDLLRAAHAREMERIGTETREAFESLDPASHLLEAIDDSIRTTAALLRVHAPTLGGFMVIATQDRQMREAGQTAHRQLTAAFDAALRAHADEIAPSDVDRALEWSFVVVYSVLARWLGLGSDPQSAGEGEWEAMLDNLVQMIAAFLLTPTS